MCIYDAHTRAHIYIINSFSKYITNTCTTLIMFEDLGYELTQATYKLAGRPRI